jgi:hypothetical protein
MPPPRFVSFAQFRKKRAPQLKTVYRGTTKNRIKRFAPLAQSLTEHQVIDRRRNLTLTLLILCAATLFAASISRAQAGPVAGEAEYQLFASGGHGINGSQMDDGVANLGARFGLVLTSPHGPGFLKGRLEYALSVLPVYCVTQKNGTACGGGVDPFAFKWILSTPKKIAPYFEIGGGTLFTNEKTPPGTSQINFTTGGALGLHFLQSKHNVSAEFRFQHISNAGMTKPNPGINTIQLRIGFGWFSQKK